MPHPDQVVVLDIDNLTAHKGEGVRELIEEGGCQLIYLPAYSHGLNAVGEAYAKIKIILRKAEARSREALIGMIEEAISAVSARDARGFFGHRRYRAMVQQFELPL